jgi:hypothetical protein
MHFEHWLVSLGKSKKTARNYSQAIYGSISKWSIDAEITQSGISEDASISELDRIEGPIRKLSVFEERNEKGKGMYGAALSLFREYVEMQSGHAVSEDIQRILEDRSISETERSTYISARVGQGQYRDRLYEEWRGCAITGYKDKTLLVASHIKPWRRSSNFERLDPYNGLLLIPNLDKVFDLGLVSFTGEGKILLSKYLEMPRKLGISVDMNVELKQQHFPYMEFHRSEVFKY